MGPSESSPVGVGKVSLDQVVGLACETSEDVDGPGHDEGGQRQGDRASAIIITFAHGRMAATSVGPKAVAVLNDSAR